MESHTLQIFVIKIYYNHKVTEMTTVWKHKNIEKLKSSNSHIIPLSELKHLLAHLSNHLLPHNKLFDHRHTQTDRVSYAHTHTHTHTHIYIYIYIYIYIIKMSPIPKKNKSCVNISLFQVTHPWSHSPSWVICMNLGLGTLVCFHETNPSVVQSYEHIPLIVLPYKFLACSKTSKPSLLEPWHAHNHHTMDSSPISSRRELNQFHAHHASLHQAHPDPYWT